jgi:hypothetical protein
LSITNFILHIDFNITCAFNFSPVQTHTSYFWSIWELWWTYKISSQNFTTIKKNVSLRSFISKYWSIEEQNDLTLINYTAVNNMFHMLLFPLPSATSSSSTV